MYFPCRSQGCQEGLSRLKELFHAIRGQGGVVADGNGEFDVVLLAEFVQPVQELFGLVVAVAAHNFGEAVDKDMVTFRTWLVRMGLNGKEFKNTRDHLLANLEGDRAWRYDKDCYEGNKKKNRERANENER